MFFHGMMGLPMRLLAVLHLLFKLSPLGELSLFAHGFAPTPPLHYCQLPPPKSTLALPADDQETAHPSPPQPDNDIDPSALLSQAYQTLTVKELRELLRQNGAKVSGNKRELVDRLAKHMTKDEEEEDPNDSFLQKLKSTNNGTRRKLLESCNHMTLKELKDILRQNGSNVSGNKRELIQRLMTLPYENHDISPSQSESIIDPASVSGSWSVLEPSISLIDNSNATIDTQTQSKEDDIERPSLSGLMFVNKPSGWSTLPTKQQLDNPTCPGFPCLSDSVKEWLYNHPQGQQRMNQALKDEKQWWKSVLESVSHNKKQHKKWRRTKEKQEAKVSTFEPRPVHRLDIDTSGIVCIALTPYALRAANMMFEKKSRDSFEDANNAHDTMDSNSENEGVQKRYVALAEGALGSEPGLANGIVRHSIGKVWVNDHNEWACDISDDGSAAFIRPDQGDASFVPESLREAVTSYQAVDWTAIKTEKDDQVDVTRVELTPYTGRGHQLRLHLASIGHPILGDDMHGSSLQNSDEESAMPMQVNGGKLCLHASKLSMDAWTLSADGTSQMCRVHVESPSPF